MGAFNTLRNTLDHKVLELRHLTDASFVVRFTRNGLSFNAGQHLSIGPKNDINMREYSIYSALDSDFLEILVKEIPEGSVSPRLKKLKPNDTIKVEGPFGFFTIEENEKDKNIFFIATGTGIAPFHCFALTHPNKKFNVLHGVKGLEECYEYNTFFSPISNCNFTACVSQNDISTNNTKISNVYKGRVTNYLREQVIDTHGIYFLCGNCDMIYEVFDILQNAGVSSEQIKAEVYF